MCAQSACVCTLCALCFVFISGEFDMLLTMYSDC